MAIAIRFSTRSDVGLVRANNQDSAFAGDRLLLVADGMGGHAGGDVASALCVASIAPLNNQTFTSSNMLERLGDAVENARIDLVEHARATKTLAGMGTTVTALLLSENNLAMAHMGDSRAYLLRDGKLTQVTRDHTFVQHLIDTGKISEAEAEVHPQRSVVMRVLGDFELDLTPDLSIREARPGDRWLLCSDGLSGFIRFETIEQTLRDVADLELCSEYLIQLALRGGGSDNITCIVADVLDTDQPDPSFSPEMAASRANFPVAQAVGSVAYGDHLPQGIDSAESAAQAAALLRIAHDQVQEVIAQAQNRVDHPDQPEQQLGLSDAAQQLPAAASAAVATDFEDTEPATEHKKASLGRKLFNTFLILVLLAGAGLGIYSWGSKQYFLGVYQGNVTIFNGFPQSLGPLHLSEKIEVSQVAVEDLPAFVAKQVYSTIRVDSLAHAQERIAQFAQDIADQGQPEAVPTADPTEPSPEGQ